jgi:hypothetical protein
VNAFGIKSRYYSVSSSGSRFFILRSPIHNVDVLCNNADVVGCKIPKTPAPISPALNPTIKR